MTAKRILPVFVVLFLVFFGGILCAEDISDPAQAAEKDSLEFVDYLNRKAGFLISVPKTWETSEKFFGAMTMFVSSEGANLNVVLEELSTAVSVKEYLAASDGPLSNVLKEFKQHEREPIATEDLLGVVSSYSHEIGEKRLKLMQAVFIFGKQAYVISCTAQYDRFSEYEPIFRKVINSFKLAE